MAWQDWGRAVFALMATLALIGLAALAVRQFGLVRTLGAGSRRRMDVVERLMLDPRRQIILLRVDDEEHVILLSSSGDKRLATRPARPQPEAGA
jgi:flagellar protein FliO/FliZ